MCDVYNHNKNVPTCYKNGQKLLDEVSWESIQQQMEHTGRGWTELPT